MNESIRKKVIDKIVSNIPEHIKPADYISASLDIAKESAYRRLRGEMSFTFDEIIILSQELDFSIDELTGRNNLNLLALDLQINKDPEQTFISRLHNYKKYINTRLKDEKSYTLMALNYLPAFFCVHFSELFKFSYYTWMHRKYKELPKLYYSDIIISDQMESLRSHLDRNTRNVRNILFILDRNVFLNPLREVNYFYKSHLINDEELEMIKKDFHNIIDFTEKIVRTGESNPGTKYDFYLSDFNVDGNSSYDVYDDNITSSFNFHHFNTIIITDPEVCEAQKEWLLSLKKYSTLITQSNEIVQEEYFDKQREYIDNVMNNDF